VESEEEEEEGKELVFEWLGTKKEIPTGAENVRK